MKRLYPAFIVILTAVTAFFMISHGQFQTEKIDSHKLPLQKVTEPLQLNPNPRTAAEKIVNGAKKEVIGRVSYDASYQRIPYPNGDVSADRGACTDVVVRALRNAGCDLQKLIHEDMAAHFDEYPRKWGLSSPDSNIDHRRVPNQMAFFRRKGRSLPIGTTGNNLRTWQPGDIVTWDLGGGVDHTGIVSDIKGDRGLYLVIHNLSTAVQEDCLDSWEITGHFRYPIR